MQFFDTIELGQAVEVTGMREMRNGSLVVHARAARGGNVQDYLGSEVERPELGIVRVYRDVNEIFKKDSLRTFGHKAVTVNHPPKPVTPRTWKDVAAGHVGEEVLRDGEFVKIPMLLADQAAIDAVKGGKRELSVGYSCDLLWEPGTTADGKEYDAKQVNIVCDHVAIVDRGRAGPDCRISDAAEDTAKTMRILNAGDTRAPDRDTPRSTADRDTPSMHKLTIDGITVDLSDTAREVVSKALADKATLVADNLKLTADLAAAGAAKDEAVRAKDGEILKLQADHKVALDAKDKQIADLQAQAITADKLDAAVAERSAVVDAAKPWLGADFDPKGKTVADIRKATVAKRLGDKAVEGKDDAHIAVAFDTLTALAPQKDALGQAIGDSLPNTRPQGDNVVQIGDAATEYARMQERDRNAWKMGA